MPDSGTSQIQSSTTNVESAAVVVATTRNVSGALCESVVAAEEIVVVAADGTSDYVELALRSLPEYSRALLAVAAVAQGEAALQLDASALTALAAQEYDAAALLLQKQSYASDEDKALLMGELNMFPLSAASLAKSIPSLAGFALSACQSRLGLFPY